MQRSRFWTGALENPLNVTNPRFQETPSGPGGPSREGLEISETNKIFGTADAARDFGVRGRSIADMVPECRPRSHVVGTNAQAGKLLPQ